jgi:hypothetical protein
LRWLESSQRPEAEITGTVAQHARALLDAAGVQGPVSIVSTDERTRVMLLDPQQLATLGPTRKLEHSLHEVFGQPIRILPVTPDWLRHDTISKI